MADDLNPTDPISDRGGNEQTTEPVSRRREGLGFLIDWDEAVSSRLAVCSSPNAAWGSARPLMKLLEHSGNDPPWIVGLCIAMATARTGESRLTFFNLLYRTLTEQLFLILLDGVLDCLHMLANVKL